MQLRVFVCAAAFFALAAAASSGVLAATIFGDNFNRANGNLVGTTPNISGGDWSQTGTIATNPVQISNNAVALGTSGQDVYAAFSSPAPNAGDGSQVHTSMDINVSAVQTSDYFTHLSDPVGTTGTFLQRVGAATATGGYFLTLAATAGGGATTNTGTTVLNLNQSYHLDLYWTFNSGADTITLSVDGVPYLSKNWDSSNAEPGQLSAVNFRQGSASAAATVTVDNLQVETIGVPEPGSFALLLIGVVAGLAKRRSR